MVVLVFLAYILNRFVKKTKRFMGYAVAPAYFNIVQPII
jgi:hypothetical protein